MLSLLHEKDAHLMRKQCPFFLSIRG